MEMKKEYLREFDALEMLLENVAKVWNKIAETCQHFFFRN